MNHGPVKTIRIWLQMCSVIRTFKRAFLDVLCLFVEHPKCRTERKCLKKKKMKKKNEQIPYQPCVQQDPVKTEPPIHSKIPILRSSLGLSKSGLKDHFWTFPKVVSNQRYTGCRK